MHINLLECFSSHSEHCKLMTAEYSWTYMRADSEGLQEIHRLAEAGKLKIPVQKTFPLAQAREAHLAKDKRVILGKVVLEID